MTTTTTRPTRGWARRLSGGAATLALLGAALLAAGCDTRSEIVMPSAEARGISVEGTGKVTVVPDVGEISMAAQVTRPTVQQARDDAAKAMDAIRAAVRGQGVEDKDVATSGFNIQPQYDYRPNGGGTPQISGYMVNNQVTVKVRKVETLSKVLDAAVSAGGNDVRVNNVQFTVDDPEKSAGAAREAAVANARTHAESLAKAAGVKLGKARTIVESGSTIPVPRAVAAAAPSLGKGGSDVATPVSPGQTEVSVSVSVVFDIE
ncbi:MAG: SIMPL domain-containing protein [Dehalococcoidia bacterium]